MKRSANAWEVFEPCHNNNYYSVYPYKHYVITETKRGGLESFRESSRTKKWSRSPGGKINRTTMTRLTASATTENEKFSPAPLFSGYYYTLESLSIEIIVSSCSGTSSRYRVYKSIPCRVMHARVEWTRGSLVSRNRKNTHYLGLWGDPNPNTVEKRSRYKNRSRQSYTSRPRKRLGAIRTVGPRTVTGDTPICVRNHILLNRSRFECLEDAIRPQSKSTFHRDLDNKLSSQSVENSSTAYNSGPQFLIDSRREYRSFEKAPTRNSQQACRPPYGAKRTTVG